MGVNKWLEYCFSTCFQTEKYTIVYFVINRINGL